MMVEIRAIPERSDVYRLEKLMIQAKALGTEIYVIGTCYWTGHASSIKCHHYPKSHLLLCHLLSHQGVHHPKDSVKKSTGHAKANG